MSGAGAKKDIFKAYASKQKKLKRKDATGGTSAKLAKAAAGTTGSKSDEAARKKAEYLKKYMSAGGGDDSDEGGVEKKKRRKKKKVGGASHRIIDEDFDWKRDSTEVKLMTLDGLDMGEEGPVVVNHEEMKLQMALERGEKLLDDAKPEAEAKFHRIDHRDGSGWGEVDEATAKTEGSDGDQSPPRRGRRQDFDGDESPPRRKRMDSDDDQSPPRRGTRMDSDGDQSPPRKRMDSDGDQSPPRRKRNDSDSDQSPPRKRVDSDSDQSPVRRGAKSGSDSDQSPVRKRARADSDSDQSPPRKGDADVTEEPERKKGLKSKEDFAAEAKIVAAKKQAALAKMGEESGAGVATVVRDETGRKLTQEEIEAKIKARTETEEEPAMEWGTGIVQKEEREQRAREAIMDSNKSFARDADDGAMNDMLRAQDRWGDPMLEQVKKNSERKERIAALKADVVREPRPVYKGDPFPNRFGIRPGYRWDGIDRTTGWEAKIVQTGINKTAMDNQAQMWNTADM
jgi:pre-mRNA-splicing factor CWC26